MRDSLGPGVDGQLYINIILCRGGARGGRGGAEISHRRQLCGNYENCESKERLRSSQLNEWLLCSEEGRAHVCIVYRHPLLALLFEASALQNEQPPRGLISKAAQLWLTPQCCAFPLTSTLVKLVASCNLSPKV